MLPNLDPTKPFVIGTTADGKPIWLDPKDFLFSSQEVESQKSSRLKGQMEGLVKELVSKVIAAREQWLVERLLKLMPVAVHENFQRFLELLSSCAVNSEGKPLLSALTPLGQESLERHISVVTHWLNVEGIHCVEDNKDGVFRLLLKRQGDVLSEFEWRPVRLDNEIESVAKN